MLITLAGSNHNSPLCEDHVMAEFQSIEQRDAFGYWLSGFTDGEGCFFLGMRREDGRPHEPIAQFRIGLRADDTDILLQIQSFLGVGKIDSCSHRGNIRVSTLRVSVVKELIGAVIPSFHRYPLRAKKARDFAIWERGVLFLADARTRKHGWGRQYAEEDRQHFAAIVESLRGQRAFESSGTPAVIPDRSSVFRQEQMFG